MEERLSMWTTYKNLKMWFDLWEQDLISIGCDNKLDRKTTIEEDQLAYIWDSPSLDGAEGVDVVADWQSLILQSKSPISIHANFQIKLITIAMVTGSSAFGEAVLPHFHFPSRAKRAENMRYCEKEGWMKSVQGKLGWDKMLAVYSQDQQERWTEQRWNQEVCAKCDLVVIWYRLCPREASNLQGQQQSRLYECHATNGSRASDQSCAVFAFYKNYFACVFYFYKDVSNYKSIVITKFMLLHPKTKVTDLTQTFFVVPIISYLSSPC